MGLFNSLRSKNRRRTSTGRPSYRATVGNLVFSGWLSGGEARERHDLDDVRISIRYVPDADDRRNRRLPSLGQLEEILEGLSDWCGWASVTDKARLSVADRQTADSFAALFAEFAQELRSAKAIQAGDAVVPSQRTNGGIQAA